jgi:ribose 5-phosphate isomerase B
MKIAIGSDHAGFEGKERLRGLIESWGHEVLDVGCHSTESCDYPDLARAVATAVAAGDVERGFLVCGSGTGMAMGANRVAGVRAVQAWSEDATRLSRTHNDANVACFGTRLQNADEIAHLARIWLDTGFDGERHARRVSMLG